MIVLDASVAVKLVVREIDSETAQQWLADITDDIGAPDLIAVEVSQAIVRRVNARDMTLADGRSTLRTWRDILEGRAILQFRSEPAQIERAAELAMRLGHPVKDCIYLALAVEHGAGLATCDVKFAMKARSLYPNVKLLADYGD